MPLHDVSPNIAPIVRQTKSSRAPRAPVRKEAAPIIYPHPETNEERAAAAARSGMAPPIPLLLDAEIIAAIKATARPMNEIFGSKVDPRMISCGHEEEFCPPCPVAAPSHDGLELTRQISSKSVLERCNSEEDVRTAGDVSPAPPRDEENSTDSMRLSSETARERGNSIGSHEAFDAGKQ